jgi:hypothetical protein
MNLNDAGFGSLRQAILDTPSGGTVDFQPGLSGTITLTTGELLIAKDLTIAGPGAGVLTVSGNQASRVFNIAATDTVTISGLTIADGRLLSVGSFGGGILNAGALVLSHCLITANFVTFFGGGGGIYNTGTLTLSTSTLQGNQSNSPGGGVYNTGTLTITDSVITANSAGSSGGTGSGGGIYNVGTLTVIDSTLSGNSTQGIGGSVGGIGRGGAIDNFGTLTITNSTLVGNSARANSQFGALGLGGAINNSGTLTITNSTFAGNSASASLGRGFGGGISNSGTLNITSSTLVGNSASASFGAQSQGGDIANAIPGANPGAVQIRNTIVAANVADRGPDLAGSFDSLGHNLVGDGTGGTGYDATDLVGTPDSPIDPQLGPLGDYGGPTPTMPPLPGSLAVDSGDNADAPATDQRGLPRIVDGFIDIGAVELQPDELTGPGEGGGASAAPAATAALARALPGAAPAGGASSPAAPPQAQGEARQPGNRDALFALLGGEGAGGASRLGRLALPATARSGAGPTLPSPFGDPDGYPF